MRAMLNLQARTAAAAAAAYVDLPAVSEICGLQHAEQRRAALRPPSVTLLICTLA